MGWKEVEDMKQKVSDYIADRLAQEGISQVFTVTGGDASERFSGTSPGAVLPLPAS
mgnify:CR=1 FL=1